MSMAAIAAKFGCERHVISRWVHDQRPSLQYLPHRRRPRKLSQVLVDEMVNDCKDQRRKSSRLLARKYGVSRRTVRRRLHERGLKPFHRPKRPKLTAAMKAKRLEFAQHWHNTDWSHAVFVDEKSFCLDAVLNAHNDIVWSLSTDDVPPRETKKYPVFTKVMVVASRKRISEPVFYEGKLSAAQYQDALEKCGLIEDMESFADPDQLVLFQDGDKAHTAKDTLRFLKRKGVAVEPPYGWPPNSPDFNPVENLWSILADRVDAQDPHTKDELEQAIIKACNEVPSKDLHSLFDSMNRRLLYVMENNGAYNKKY